MNNDLERVAQVNELLGSMQEFLGDIKGAIVRVNELDLLEENARWMSNEMFQNLVTNIEKDGAVASTPYCWKQPSGRYLVLSGNHRIKAARVAGREWILILFNDGEMSEQMRIAKQLSHNAIAGQDDPVILKRLWDRIDVVDLKLYAGLDDKTLKELERVSLPALSEVRLDFRTATFMFLPEELRHVDQAFKNAVDQAPARELYLARLADFDRLMDALAKTQDAYNIRNAAAAMMVLLDVFAANQTELESGWNWRNEEQAKQASWVPLAALLGTDRVPIAAAKTIQRALQKMMDSGNVERKNLWQSLEYWAAEYLTEDDYDVRRAAS